MSVSLLFVGGSVVVKNPPAEAIETCSSTGVCFYVEPQDLPLTGFSQSIPRGVCHNVPADQTHYVDNNTDVRWYVFRTSDCTGDRGPLYPNRQGFMSGVWDRSIRSTYRTSALS